MKFRQRIKVEAGLRQIDIVPLIDCVFLLLIFFMLTSSFMIMPGINVKLPKVVTAEEVDTRTLTIVISSEDIYYLQKKARTAKEIEESLKKGKHESIFIKADKDSSFGAFTTIYDIAKRLGVDRISYATTYEE